MIIYTTLLGMNLKYLQLLENYFQLFSDLHHTSCIKDQKQKDSEMKMGLEIA